MVTHVEPDDSSADRYAFRFSDRSPYAAALQLIDERFPSGDGELVLLDVGCGYGPLAERCQERGYQYVGIDIQGSGLDDLAERGFETHQIDLDRVGELPEQLRDVLKDRRLGGLLALDVIGHVRDTVGVLAALHGLALEHEAAPLVICVANVSHFDVAAKLLQARWDSTELGLLDAGHLRFFTEPLLDRTTRHAGWHAVAEQDFRLLKSDQHFPAGNIALSSPTPLHQLLRQLRSRAASGAETVQFVRAYLPGAPDREPTLVETREPRDRPFLTVLTRTQGNRIDTLQETLLCLAAQSDPDFEVLVLAHNVTPEQALQIDYLCSTLPAGIADRFTVVPVTGPGRCRPLNAGVELARGRYLAILDDDDLVTGSWVAEYHRLAEESPGRVLRTRVGVQDIMRTPWGDRPGYAPAGAVRTPYPPTFDLFHHITENTSPNCGLAFPTSCFHDLGIRFNEALPVLEDWDVLLQTVQLCGIASSPRITSIYRNWSVGRNSLNEHSSAEWEGAHAAVIAQLDGRPALLPPGTMTRIRDLHAQLRQAQERAATAEAALAGAHAAHHELAAIHQTYRSSTSWRVAAPVRLLARAGRKGKRRLNGIA